MSRRSNMNKVVLVVIALLVSSCGSTGGSSAPGADTSLPPSPLNTALPEMTPTPVPDGPCDNPLVPLGANNQWEYRVTNGKGEAAYLLKVLGRQDEGNIITLVEFTDVNKNAVIQEPVVCLNGAIENFPLFVNSMLFSGYLNHVLDTYHDSGVYAPAYTELAANNWSMDWKAEYLVEEGAFLNNPMGGSDLAILQSTPLHVAFVTYGAREPISVPAGDFPQAIKVFHEYRLLVSVTIPGGATTGELIVNATYWFEPYVGLVSARLDEVKLSSNGMDYTLPFLSQVELQSFTH